MKVNFGTCIFTERPKDCQHGIYGSRECTGRDWEILKCYMDHYGNKLVKDAPLRLIDSFTHILVDNDDVEDEC